MTAPLRDTLGAVRTDRDVVEVAGPDAASYLQGQCSQDVEALAEGASAWTFVLQPDGKVAVWGRVTRVAPDRFVLDVDPGAGPALITRLERFKLRVDAAVTPLDWTVLAVRGPGATEIDTGDALAVDPEWPGVEGIDLLGPAPRAPAGVPAGDAADLEALRIEAGVPAMGHELTEQTIPAEAGVVERSVSFTKGCYTGQELVARIDSRGNKTPSRLVRLAGTGPAPAPGTPLSVEGTERASVTTAVASAAAPSEAWLGLGYLHRSVDTPAQLSLPGGAAVTAEATSALE